MAMTYNLDEVFEIAERIEKNGATFYRCAADMHQDSDARELFLRLARDEDTHERIFRELRRQLVTGEDSITAYDRDETVVGYLQALAGSYVFLSDTKPEEELARISSVADILKTAMSKERDSISLYLGIRQVMADTDKEKVSTILEEEQRHLVDLIAALAALERGS